MKTKEAILALKLGCKVRRESWAPGEWIIYDSSYNNTSSEDGSLYLELEDFIPCYGDIEGWELFNDNS